MSIIFLII